MVSETKYSSTREVKGEEFEVIVKERGNKWRKVIVHHVPTREEKGHSYVIGRDIRECRRKTIKEKLRLKQPDPLPPRQDHIVDTFNLAIAAWFNSLDKRESTKEKINESLDAVTEVWNEEL